MMPLALWAAMSLKAGYPVLPATGSRDWPAYLAVVAVSIPTFVRLGLYRAVIRFLGHKAVFAVAFAVALSGLLLGILRHGCSICRALSWSVVAIYSCLALLYVAGSRFVVRYYLLTRHIQPTEARVAIYGAGEAGARLSTVLSTTRAFDPLVFIDDNEACTAAWSTASRSIRRRSCRPSSRLETSTASCWRCPRSPAAAGARS